MRRTELFSLRRLVPWALVAAILGAGGLPHRHAGLDDESSGGRGAESVLTAHNPLSAAAHFHPILKVVQEDPCWACHWHRLPGAPHRARVFVPVLSGHTFTLLPPRSAISVARFTRLSRGPPVLL